MGVPRALREAWSSRHRQVQDAIRARVERRHAQLAAVSDLAPSGVAVLERPSGLSPAEERVAALESRAPKDGVGTEGDLDRTWWQTAHAHGFDARSVEQLRRAARTPLREAEIDRAVTVALTECDATFATREARATALEQTSGLGLHAAHEALGRLSRRGSCWRWPTAG